MAITEGLSSFKIESVENAICLEDVTFENISTGFKTGITVEGQYYPIKSTMNLDVYHCTRPIKMHIPKLMPFYRVERPYTHELNVNNSIVINANRPHVNSKITTCNYILVKPPRMMMPKRGLSFGESVQVMFPNKNITEPTFVCLK